MGSVERTNPRFLAPFFGRTPALPEQARRTLLLVSLGLFFENYDISLVNAALPQLAEELGIAAQDTGFYLSVIRLGGLGAFLLVPFADRFGRRRTFLVCLAGMSFGTFATALSQTPLQFTACQMLSRAFLMTAAALAVVMVVEELPAELRGGGIALLGILGGVGFGVGAGFYAGVDLLPFGWRALYAFGVLPVLLLPFLRRTLRETRRFEQEPRRRAQGSARAWLGPVVELARTHPRRAAAIGLAGAFSAMSGIAFFQYTSWMVIEVHGWAPGHYSLLVVGGGLIGVLGNVLGGRGSDRFGRRRIGFGGLLLLPLCVALFALGPAHTLVVAWGLVVLCSSAAGIVLRALATELFPTSHRATAGGWLVLVETLGWSLGLLLVGILADSGEDLPHLVALLALASLPAAGFLLLVPETHRRELEQTAS